MELILNSRLDLREKNNDKITIMKIKRKNDSKRTMKEIGYIYLTHTHTKNKDEYGSLSKREKVYSIT